MRSQSLQCVLALIMSVSVFMPSGGAWGADGDAQTVAGSMPWSFVGGWKMRSWLLCENRDADDTSCDEFDTYTKGASPGSRGWSQVSIRTINKNGTTPCTGNVTARNYSEAGGGPGTFKPTLQILTIGGTESVRVEGPLRRFIDLDITNLTGCTVAGSGNNNFEVTLEVYSLD